MWRLARYRLMAMLRKFGHVYLSIRDITKGKLNDPVKMRMAIDLLTRIRYNVSDQEVR